MPEESKQQLEYPNLLAMAHRYYVIVKEGIETDDLRSGRSIDPLALSDEIEHGQYR
jgi:hypothetical protein